MAAHRPGLVLAVVLPALLAAGGVAAQSAAHDHIRHVSEAFPGTPGGTGLLPTALAEAEVAAQHARLAATDARNLGGAQRHMTHVLHALDPSIVGSGPGLGYGLRRAAEEAAGHIELAARADTTSLNLTTHARHIAAALDTALANADRLVELAQRILETTDAAEAAPLITQAAGLADAVHGGVDADGDGRIGWRAGEGGLRQAFWHLTLMRRGEGLID